MSAQQLLHLADRDGLHLDATSALGGGKRTSQEPSSIRRLSSIAVNRPSSTGWLARKGAIRRKPGRIGTQVRFISPSIRLSERAWCIRISNRNTPQSQRPPAG